MRISNQQRQQNEARIRAAMDRLLRGEIPVGGNCDISTLAKEADVDRTAFYGTRPYAHLREEFETRLARIREAGDPIGPSEGQISRLKNENAKLKPPGARQFRNRRPHRVPNHSPGQTRGAA
jgi:hypothetical protein